MADYSNENPYDNAGTQNQHRVARNKKATKSKRIRKLKPTPKIWIAAPVSIPDELKADPNFLNGKVLVDGKIIDPQPYDATPRERLVIRQAMQERPDPATEQRNRHVAQRLRDLQSRMVRRNE